jgi:hypothetical protein
MEQVKIKTKEVEPKVYAILFVRGTQQILKMVVGYSFEDAVGSGRRWIMESQAISPAEAIQFVPMLFETAEASLVIDSLAEGIEVVISDVNMIMNKVISAKNKTEARKLLKEYKENLSETSVKYLEAEIKKMG